MRRGVSGRGDIIDREARRPVAPGARSVRSTHCLSELAFVIGLLIGELRCREHVLRIDDEQEIVVGLQMDVPGSRRRGEVVHGAWPLGVTHVNDAESLGEHVADVGEPAMHHDLHAIGPAALVAMREDAHLPGVIWFRQVRAHGWVLGVTCSP